MASCGSDEIKVSLYLGLGSNLGDRRGNLLKALEMLDRAFSVHYDRLSRFIETEPWGFDAPDKFLNAVVKYTLSVPRGTSDSETGLRILSKCKETEAAMGRSDAPEYSETGRRIYHSRVIDIDILLLGNSRVNENGLVIPHPLMTKRDFVMVPLMEIVSEDTLHDFPDIFGACQ